MILPQLPHSRRTDEIQASFSRVVSPSSIARAWLTGSSSQKTHLRQRGGTSSRLSRVMLARRRDTTVPLRVRQTGGPDHPFKVIRSRERHALRPRAHRTHDGVGQSSRIAFSPAWYQDFFG